MSDEREEQLKLACLHHASGNLDHAKALYTWVSGEGAPSPDAEFECGFYCGLKDSPTAPGSPSGMRGWKEGDALRKRFKEMEARLRTRGDDAEGVHDKAAPTTVSDSGEGESELPPIPEGFTKWEGATATETNPNIDPATEVEIIHRAGWRDIGLAGDYEWEWSDVLRAKVPEFAADFEDGDDIIAYRVIDGSGDKPLIVDDTPTIPRSEIPQGAAVETFTDAGVETVKLSGITHIVDDEPERVAETQPEAAYAPIHNVDEPSDSAVFGHGINAELDAREDKRSWLGLFGGKKLAEEGV